MVLAGDFVAEIPDDAIDRHLDLLAHHYWHTENRPKKREYLLRAGIAARPAPVPIVVDREVTITEGITVKDLSEKLGVKARDLIRRLLVLAAPEEPGRR